MGMRVKPGQEEKLELNMTPMIDVVFQLLIFFMVTLRIPPTEAIIETALPKAKGPGEVSNDVIKDEEEFEDIRLIIAKDQTGTVQRFVNQMMVRSDRQLKSQLVTMKGIHAKGRVVVVCGDDVPYQHLVRAISLVQEAGLPIAFGDAG
jgi:biopolymer transport protein ExbD